MNKVILSGRLTKDPEIRYSQGSEPLAIARYGLAVNRKFKKQGQPDADFINIVAFGRNGEFAEKYLKKGMKIGIIGSIQTGSYTDKDGVKRYTTDIVVEEHEFMESKKAFQENTDNTVPNDSNPPVNKDDFVSIDNFDDDDLPF